MAYCLLVMTSIRVPLSPSPEELKPKVVSSPWQWGPSPFIHDVIYAFIPISCQLYLAWALNAKTVLYHYTITMVRAEALRGPFSPFEDMLLKNRHSQPNYGTSSHFHFCFFLLWVEAQYFHRCHPENRRYCRDRDEGREKPERYSCRSAYDSGVPKMCWKHKIMPPGPR